MSINNKYYNTFKIGDLVKYASDTVYPDDYGLGIVVKADSLTAYVYFAKLPKGLYRVAQHACFFYKVSK
jgi:hypothetical protein